MLGGTLAKVTKLGRMFYSLITSCDPYYNNVALLLHMDGFNGSTTFTDNSPAPKTITPNAGAQVNTSIVKYGTGSGSFNGNWLSAPNISTARFDSGDFTVEAWIYISSFASGTVQTIMGQRDLTGNGWSLHVNQLGQLFLQATGGSPNYVISASGAIQLNNWYHVAASKSGITTRLFINGVVVDTNTTLTVGTNTVVDFRVGRASAGIDYYYTGYIDDIRLTSGVARYTGNFTPPAAAFPNAICNDCDPYFSGVSLLLHMDGTNGSTTFVDNSPVANTITANGGAQVNTSIVKYGTGSVTLNGVSGTYLSAPSSIAFVLGSTDFTIEGWIRPSSSGGNRAVISRRTSGWVAGNWTMWINMNDSSIAVYSYEFDPSGYTPIVGGTGVVANTWQHFAWVRSGNVFSLYLNGVQISTITSSITIADNSQPVFVGSENSSFSSPFNGYIDDVRITKGVARYISNFTPPAAAFPNTGCTDLTGTATVVVPETFNANNTVVLQSFNTVPVPETFNADNTVVVQSFNTVPVPETFNGNGTVVLQSFNTVGVPATFSAGAGIFDVNLYDPTYSNVSLLLHMDGTNGSTTFPDNSSAPKTVTANGGAQVSTSTVLFGTASGSLGSTGYLSVPYSIDLNLSSGDFTIEAFIINNYNAGSQILFNFGTGTDLYPIQIWINSSGKLAARGQNTTAGITVYSIVGTTGVSLGVWHHVAFTKSADTYMLFLNGVLEASVVYSGPINTGSWPLYIGAYSTGIASARNAFFDDVRITKGVARYTTNFTPPFQAFPNYGGDPNYSNISLLLHANGANGSTTFLDNSPTPKSVTANGGAQINTSVVKYGSGSALFNGASTTFLTVPASTGFVFGTGDFTIEAWIYLPSTPSGSYAAITDIRGTGAGNGAILFAINSSRNLVYYSDISFNSSNTVPLTTWTHVALVRSSGVVTFWINGVSSGSSSDGSNKSQNPTVYIGRVYDNAHPAFNGYIDDLRITKGVGRYTSKFVPPTQQFSDS